MRRKMKYLRTLLLILYLGFGMCAFAAEPVKIGTPEDVVKLLYRDFGWEITTESSSKTILLDQPSSVLTRYFTPKLARLIVKDRKYEKGTTELGHIDFILLCGGQDPDGIRNIRINRGAAENIVTVIYDQNGEKDVMNIDFNTVKTKSGWRISNVHYKTRKSKAFPDPGVDFSLLNLLSQPY